MAYKGNNKRYDSPQAREMVNSWNSALLEMQNAKRWLLICEDNMIRKICPYKVGEVLADKQGKKFVIKKISLNRYALEEKGGASNDGYIDFEYTFVALRKDGKPSNNGRAWLNIEETERTGETIDMW
jgi:hypothetical protein